MAHPTRPSPSDNLMKLPDELLIKIASLIYDGLESIAPHQPGPAARQGSAAARQGLLSLTCVSKRLNTITQPILYKKVFIYSTEQLLSLVKTLEHHPEQADTIQDLALFLYICKQPLGVLRNTPQHQRHVNITTNALLRLLNQTRNVEILRLAMEDYVDSSVDQLYQGPSDEDEEITPSGPSSFNEAVRAAAGNFLPRLETLQFSNVDCPKDLQEYTELLALPSLKRVICDQNPEGDWSIVKPPSPATTYPNIASLKIEKSAVWPSDIHTVCQLFPSLTTLNITTDPDHVLKRMQHKWWQLIGKDFAQVSLAGGLSKLDKLEHLSLNAHWGLDVLDEDIAVYAGAISPTGGLSDLGQFTNLTTLTIGLHMILTIPTVNANNQVGILAPASVIPAGLGRFTLYHCDICTYAWVTNICRVQDLARSFISDLASAKLSGEFFNLAQVIYHSRQNEWYSPRNDHSVSSGLHYNHHGEVWNPGCFSEDLDAFQNNGVYFEAVQSREFHCQLHGPVESRSFDIQGQDAQLETSPPPQGEVSSQLSEASRQAIRNLLEDMTDAFGRVDPNLASDMFFNNLSVDDVQDAL